MPKSSEAPAAPRWIDYLPLDKVIEADRNPKLHDVNGIDRSMSHLGIIDVITLDDRTGKLISGHGRRKTIERKRESGDVAPDGIVVNEAGEWFVPVVRGWSSRDDEEADAAIVALNELTITPGWENAGLAEMLGELRASRPELVDVAGYGGGRLDELLSSLQVIDVGEAAGAAGSTLLSDRFLVPPFSVLDARQGYWRSRKEQWLGLGIQSEVGRPKNLLKMSEQVLNGYGEQAPNRSVPSSDSGNDPQFYYKKRLAEREAGRELTTAEFLADWYEGPDAYTNGTSVFDPVLAELVYRWFCPPGGTVLDPFAGGSVRGIVAGRVGLAYTGVELRGEQIAANEDQRAMIAPDAEVAWLEGDSREVVPLLDDEFDLVFSCPPYFDLEQYSDDPNDLSNMPWDEFLAAYRAIIAASVAALRPDRFACFVIGEVRDPQGINRGLVAETARAFVDAGADFYNDAVLITSVGSLALRAARIFGGGRKLAKAHQNVLVFCKGDPSAAVEACGELILPDPAALFTEVEV